MKSSKQFKICYEYKEKHFLCVSPHIGRAGNEGADKFTE
jgi:hypothetical protein